MPHQNDTHKDLMEKMEHLYRVFYRRLYLYAMTFLDDEDESKDVVGDVFQMIWEDWESDRNKLEEISASFLFIAVRNRCLDTLRHAQLSSRYNEMFAATASVVTDEGVAEFERRVNRLHKAVKSLPEPGRSVLRCVYFNKMTYKQTAEHLCMTENMVHKNMVKVFRLLRLSVGQAEMMLALFISAVRLYS